MFWFGIFVGEAVIGKPLVEGGEDGGRNGGAAEWACGDHISGVYEEVLILADLGSGLVILLVFDGVDEGHDERSVSRIIYECAGYLIAVEKLSGFDLLSDQSVGFFF